MDDPVIRGGGGKGLGCGFGCGCGCGCGFAGQLTGGGERAAEWWTAVACSDPRWPVAPHRRQGVRGVPPGPGVGRRQPESAHPVRGRVRANRPACTRGGGIRRLPLRSLLASSIPCPGKHPRTVVLTNAIRQESNGRSRDIRLVVSGVRRYGNRRLHQSRPKPIASMHVRAVSMGPSTTGPASRRTSKASRASLKCVSPDGVPRSARLGVVAGMWVHAAKGPRSRPGSSAALRSSARPGMLISSCRVCPDCIRAHRRIQYE
jgi:hypothetical protein